MSAFERMYIICSDVIRWADVGPNDKNPNPDRYKVPNKYYMDVMEAVVVKNYAEAVLEKIGMEFKITARDGAAIASKHIQAYLMQNAAKEIASKSTAKIPANKSAKTAVEKTAKKTAKTTAKTTAKKSTKKAAK